MTRLILIRHGETDWNVQGRWQGHTDIPLNQNGHEQSRQLANDLKNDHIDAIYTSDLQRARQTARLLSEEKGVAIQVDPRLREINLGVWEGLTRPEIEENYLKELEERRIDQFNVAAPEGETGAQVQKRSLAAIGDIMSRHPTGSVAIIAHGYTLAVLRAHFTGVPFERVRELIPANGEIIELDVRDGNGSKSS